MKKSLFLGLAMISPVLLLGSRFSEATKFLFAPKPVLKSPINATLVEDEFEVGRRELIKKVQDQEKQISGAVQVEVLKE